jgi:hypothetical protein
LDAAEVTAKTITDGVLDAQRDELDALQRALDRIDIDPNRLLGHEPFWPWRLERQAVDVFLLA